MVMISVDVANN